MNTETEKRAADALAGIAAAACGTAWRSAQVWLLKHGKKTDNDALARAIKHATKRTINEALRDAREAIAVNMPDAAVQTFRASMVIAGIEAAKEVTR